MALATIEPPVNGPTFASLFEQADRMLDAYLERERAIDHEIIRRLDNGQMVDLDTVITAVTLTR